MNKLNIALLTDGIAPFVTGGMQRHSANLAKYFTLAGANVTLVHCLGFEQELPNEAEVNNQVFGADSELKLFSVVTLHFPKPGKVPGHYIRNSYQYSKTIYNCVDFTKVDFVYAKGFSGWYYLEQKKKGVVLPPIGVKFHGYEMFQVLPSVLQKVKANILRKATVWNNENADYIFSYGGKITELIKREFDFPVENIWDFTSGIDGSWLSSGGFNKGSKVNFIFIGRNEVRKGSKELHHVLNKLKNEYDFHFHFVGPIELKDRINSDKITYYGELRTKHEICEVLDKMDVLVCPSHSEGMPNVILEGMARGLAILATNVGAVEMLVDNSNGKLIEAMDVLQLEKSLIEFIQMAPAQLLKKREASLVKVSNDYLWNSVIQQIIQKINFLKR